jgi:hypothetical protein
VTFSLLLILKQITRSWKDFIGIGKSFLHMQELPVAERKMSKIFLEQLATSEKMGW